MNKKAIAIDVLKHPLIKKLLETNAAPSSVIASLIVKELLGETLKNRMIQAAQNLPPEEVKALATDPESDEGGTITDDEQQSIEMAKEIDTLFSEFEQLAEKYLEAEYSEERLKAFVIYAKEKNNEAATLQKKYGLETTEQVGTPLGAIIETTVKLLLVVSKQEDDMVANFKSTLEEFMEYAEKSPKKAMDLTSPKEEPPESEPSKDATKTLIAAATDEETQEEIASNAETEEEIGAAVDRTVAAAKEEGADQEKAKAAGEKAKEEIIDKMADSDDEDDNVPKEEFANLFEKENDGNVPSLADAFDYFSDKFVSTRYMEEQRKAINDVFAALAAFREGMKDLRGSSLTPTDTVTEAVEPTEEITPEETSELKQKQQEMIQALKNMAALIKAGDKEEDLFSKSRKDRIKREAEALQILLMDVNALLVIETAPASPTPLQEVTRNEKIENIKKVYATVNPIMLKVDEIVRNFKNPEERVNVSVSTINDALDKIENELKTIQPYFGKRQTAFTKDKMSYKNLAGMVKRFAKQLAQIITEMNGAMKDGKITFEGSRSLANKMKEISEDIEKYIGAPSRLKVKSTTDVEVDDEEDEEELLSDDKKEILNSLRSVYSLTKATGLMNRANDAVPGTKEGLTTSHTKALIQLFLNLISEKEVVTEATDLVDLVHFNSKTNPAMPKDKDTFKRVLDGMKTGKARTAKQWIYDAFNTHRPQAAQFWILMAKDWNKMDEKPTLDSEVANLIYPDLKPFSSVKVDDETMEEQLTSKLETVVEAQIVKFLNKDKVKGGLDTISITGTEQKIKKKFQPGRWVKKGFEPKEQEIYSAFRQTYVQEIEAIQEYISVQRTMRMTEKDKNILELCEQIVIWWNIFSERPSVSAAEEFHKRYIQLIKLAGLPAGQSQNFVNIDDETMEEKLVKRLTHLVEQTFKRK